MCGNSTWFGKCNLPSPLTGEQAEVSSLTIQANGRWFERRTQVRSAGVKLWKHKGIGSWKTGAMATSIQLAPEIEQRLDSLVSETGRTKTFYLNEMIERGLEDIEDYYLAADVLERVRQGKEQVCSSDTVRNALLLGD